MITIAIAVVCGVLGLKTKFPAGAIVGSLIGVAVFQVLTGKAELLPNTKLFTQCVAGLFIGKNINRKNVSMLPGVWKPALVTTFGVILFCIGMGYVLSYIGGYDLGTALFCCAPGGMLDMTLAADDMGADASVVSVMQLGRYIAVVLLLPWVLKICSGKEGREKIANKRAENMASDSKTDAIPVKTKVFNASASLAVAIICGWLGSYTGLPASGIIFSMLGVMAFNLIVQRAFMPLWMKRVAQILAGAVIGTNITLDGLMRMKDALVPALCIVGGFVLMNILVGLLVHRISDLDLLTSFFCCCPGGMSDVILIADEYGADTPRLTLVQLSRCVCAMSFFPTIVYLLAAG